MKNYLKMNRDGFTLVELMVVVAIIGVLASIALPQYAKFTAKARQAEVKIALGSAYQVEQTFSTENGSYSACLGQLGFNRDGSKFYYAIGTTSAGATCGPAGGVSCDLFAYTSNGSTPPVMIGLAGSQCTAANGMTFPANASDGGAAGVTGAVAAGTNSVSGTTFSIGGAGRINKGAAAGLNDTWTIDQQKNLVNRVSGI